MNKIEGMHRHWPAALCLALAALPAAYGAELPPLGLYRIDFQADLAFPDAPVRVSSTVDGASGDTTATNSAGPYSATRQYKGERPVTHCVKAITGGAPLPPQALACTNQRTVKTKDGWDVTASCPGSQMHLTIRQLDQERWEFVHHVTMLSTGRGPSMAGVDMVLRQQAQHGATPEEREKARQQLAQVPAMQQQNDAKYAEAIARMQRERDTTTDPQEKAALTAALAKLAPGNPTMLASSRQLWTRISNSCQ